jgi:hypothetical protein
MTCWNVGIAGMPKSQFRHRAVHVDRGESPALLQYPQERMGQ